MIYAKNWEEISLGKHALITDALIDPQTGPLQKAIAVMTALSGEDYSVYPAAKVFSGFAEHEFLQKPVPSKLILKTVIDGEEYEGNVRIDAISAGQLIDVFHVAEPNDYRNWPELMAIVYLKKGEKYDGRNNPQRAALFREKMPCTVAYGYAVFFCLYWKRLKKGIQIFSDKMNRRTSSQNNGVGSRLLRFFAIRT